MHSLPLLLHHVLLLAIVAGNKHLILRTREDDVTLVSRLTTLTLHTVFGYTTHRFRCHPTTAHQPPSDFLRALFLDNNKHRQRRVSSSCNSAAKLAPSVSVSTARTSIAQSIQLKPSFATLGRPQSDSDDPDREPNSSRPGLHPTGVQTDMSAPTLAAIAKSHLKNASHSSTDVLKPPNVVVVSGLELASLPCQKALLRTLAERKIVVSDEGVFGHDHDGSTLELPDGFFMVYVCRSDPRERPPIYKSLLDMFAMSSSVDVGAQTRLAMRQFRPPSSPSITSPYSSVTSAAFSLSSSLPGPPTPPQTMPSPVIPAALVQRLKNLCATHARIRPPLVIYLADLFSATRHYGPLDGMMLTVRARRDAEALARASRVLGTERTGAELIREQAERSHDTDSVSTYPYTHTSVAASTEGLLDGADVPETYEMLDHSTIPQHPTERLHLDVSEADIARIFPRVVSHRIRVRDSPLDEILSSAVCGAISAPGNEPHEDGTPLQWERETVKDILVHILSEV